MKIKHVKFDFHGIVVFLKIWDCLEVNATGKSSPQ